MAKYYMVNFIDGRDGKVKDWGTWDDPNNPDLRGNLDKIIKVIHAARGEITDISVIEEE